MRPALIIAGLLPASLLALDEARACGGFFCATQPVVQTREGIIFAVDRTAHTVEATINITYQGSAQDFAWVLPLQSNPEVSVGASWTFATIDRLTAPQFPITSVETVGSCAEANFAAGGGVRVSGGADAPPRAAAGPKDAGVNVLQQGQTGPYMRVVLEGQPDKVEKWLTDNGYRVTPEMMALVTPYIAKGDVLLALKLLKDNDAGDIQPIKVKMSGEEACIPLRLTAIAAQLDMDIMTFVLSNEGRAIPKNYLHVTPNLARIDWMNGGRNYRQLISAAADEGMGNAFTTEFAGPTSIFRDQIWREGQLDLMRLRTSQTLADFVNELARQGLLSRKETAGILARRVSDDQLARAGIDRTTFTQCPTCVSRTGASVPYDPKEAADDIAERIEKPEREAQATFDSFRYATRLYTLISPSEMNLDPEIAFDASLPDVSNVHGAKMILDCGFGGFPGSAGVEIQLEDGTVIRFDSSSTADRTLLDAMPASVTVDQLVEKSVVKDNRKAISALLEEHNAQNGAGCGCASGSGSAAKRGSLFGLVALAALLVTRRRASRR